MEITNLKSVYPISFTEGRYRVMTKMSQMALLGHRMTKLYIFDTDDIYKN